MSSANAKFFGTWFLLAALALNFVACGKDRSKLVSHPGIDKPATDNNANSNDNGTSQVNWDVAPPPLFLPTPILPVYANGIHAPLLSLGGAVYGGTVPTDYCKNYGDALTAAQGLERLKWAERCYPEWNEIYTVARSVKNAQQQPVTLYPTFGRWNEQDHPYNPLNYKAPTTASAPCNLPAYEIVVLCAPY